MSTVAEGGKINGLVIVGVVVGVVIFCMIVVIIGLAAIGVFCWCRISSKKPPDHPATIFLSQQSQNSILSQAQTPLSPSAPAPPPRPLDTLYTCSTSPCRLMHTLLLVTGLHCPRLIPCCHHCMPMLILNHMLWSSSTHKSQNPSRELKQSNLK